jgi:hypothetical protein
MENDEDENYEIEGWGGGGPLYSDTFLMPNKKVFSIRKIFDTIKKYHHQQILNVTDTTTNINPEKTIQELKDLFKGFFLDKSVHVFEFLTQPITNHGNLHKVLKLLHRIQKKELPVYNTIEELILSTDLESEKAWLESKLTQPREQAQEIDSLKAQILIYLQLWKETIGELCNNEKELLECLLRFEVIQKRIDMIMELPDNESLPDVIKGLEAYVSFEFENSKLQNAYTNCITTYKKIYLLRDLISIFHTFKNENQVPFCMVCFTNHISIAFVPCGHTFCEDCTSRVSRGFTCFVCRQTITQQQKLYFS